MRRRTADTEDRPATRRLRARLLGARLAVAWERLWFGLWPATAVAGLFAALALLDAPAHLPVWLHALLLLAFAAVLVFRLYRCIRSFAMPDDDAARRRLETANDAAHRPLGTLSDRLAAGVGDPAAEALWRMHRARMAAAARGLRIGLPSPGLARRDAWALRGVLALAIVVGLAVAGPEADERLARAIQPDFGTLSATPPARLELWITPPDYTGAAPLFPKPAADAATEPASIPVPMASVLTAQVAGGRGTPDLVFAGTRTTFRRIDAANTRIALTIERSGPLAVEQDGTTLGAWTVTAIPDEPPSVAFAAPPGRTGRAALRIAFGAGDDYGLEEVVLEIRRSYERGAVTGKETLEIDLPLPAPGVRDVEDTAYRDLTPHPWAGLPVALRLRARDVAGQTGRSDEVRFVLPERDFRHPVAREIVEQRRRLTAEPERRSRVVEELADLAQRPGAFDHDTVAFLALASARARLTHDEADDAISPVRDLLWDTALRIEDGRFSIAERDLRRVRDALMEALANDASDAELERLMRQLQDTLDRFMQALARQMRDRPRALEELPFDPRRQLLETTDLQRMLDRIRELMRAGSRQAARDMLAQLRHVLENLRAGRMSAGDPQTQAGDEALRRLRELIRRQGELLDRTFRQSQRRSGGPMREALGDGAAEQRALREALRRLRRMLGRMSMEGEGERRGSDQALGQAGQAMEDAARALGLGAPGEAVGPQGRALDALQRAGRSMIQSMMDRFARQSGMGLDRRFNPLRQRRDPLGRHVPGDPGMDTRDVDIPDEGAVERAQDVLDELRRRSSERFRPRFELDYIDRLLQRF